MTYDINHIVEIEKFKFRLLLKINTSQEYDHLQTWMYLIESVILLSHQKQYLDQLYHIS